MYKPQPKKQDDNANNRLKLPAEVGCPSMAKVKFMLEEATNRRGCLVELPWTAGNAEFISTCQWESTVEEPVWTLYQEESGGSKVVWTQSFAPSDLEFMYDILMMSAPKGTSSTKIPELLQSEDDKKPIEQQDTNPDPKKDISSGSFPEVAPLPQPGMGAGMGMGLGGGVGPMPGNQATSHPPQGAPNPPHQPQQHQQQPPQQPPYGGPPAKQILSPPQQPPYGGYPGQQMPYPPQQPPYGGYPGQMPPQGYPAQGQMPPQSGQMPYDPYGSTASMSSGGVVPVDYNLMDKRPNVLIGSMLKEAELISNATLEAALKLQEMVREEKLSAEKAPSVLKRLHKMGADIDQHLTPEDLIRKPRKKAPEASQAAPSKNIPAGKETAAVDPNKKPKRNLKPAFDLLEKAGILSSDDVKDALAVRKKHGGDLVGILEAANKLNRKTVDAAFICLPLIREGLMKSEQCIIALNYCSRMRVGFDEALDEMGWQNPRKLRSDLPLN